MIRTCKFETLGFEGGSGMRVSWSFGLGLLLGIAGLDASMAQTGSARSGAVTALCRFAGTVGTIDVENSGATASTCTASCYWVTGSKRCYGHWGKVTINAGQKQTIWTSDCGETILRSEDVRLTCD
jgi:hypothetical protein